MNSITAIPLTSLNQPGNLWINKASKQIRYSLDKDKPSTWLQPLSVYQVGDDSSVSGETFIKRGQPVSIGFIDELNSELQVSGDPCVVPTNPHIHQWCIGLSLEPGEAHLPINDGTINDHVHVLSHGQIEYTLNDSRPNSYQPPNDGTRYAWNYNDIGKPVMVSNYPGEKGGLTIDITHAYFDGANIITVGRIADAPVPPGTPGMPAGQDDQKIVIEVQLAGDVRGMIDSTQFDVHLSSDAPVDKDGKQIEYTQAQDRLIFVKMVDDPATNKPLGIMITDDAILLENGGLNSPLGCFLAKSKNGKIRLAEYANQTVLLHRLGIIEANFGYPESDAGKDLYLNNGAVVTTGTALSYEYKVGVVIEPGRVLIDCRYPRIFAKFEMVGKIKPAYTDKNTGTLIADPGYVIVDPTVVHKVRGTYTGDTQTPLVDYSEMIKLVMYQGIIQYSPTATGTFADINGTWTYDTIKDGYFKFKNIFYSIDGQVNSQIKFSNEGAPENIQYLWPEMYFQGSIPPGKNSWRLSTSLVDFDISYLYNLGAYIDGNGANIEAYEITCRLPPDYGGRYVSPGFSTVVAPDGTLRWIGYEWSIYFNEFSQTWRLVMITNPGSDNPASPDYIPDSNVLGFTYPPGKNLTHALPIEVVVRRRPTQYHNLFLNQLNIENPWKPYTTGENLVTDDTLYFGQMFSGITTGSNETYWTLDWKGANYITFANLSKTGTGTNTKYNKLLRYNVGPYYENDLVATKLVNILTVQYQPVNLSGMVVSGYSIEWNYDFDNNIAYLGAEFAPKLLSYPTTSGNKTNVYEDYIAGATSGNISGIYTYPRSAMKTLHEVPTQFFNYSNDVDFSHRRIHTAQEAWNIDGTNIERYQPANFPREIFPPVSGIYHEGTKYTYQSYPAESDKQLQREWEHIQEEINYMFNSIVRDAGGNIVRGGDTTYIHTNLGLLNHAAKESQNRLLRLERSLFGGDYDQLPYGVNKTQDYRIYKKLENTLHDGGVAREIQFLYDQKLLNTKTTAPGFASEYNTILWELYGDYFDLESYYSMADSSGYQTNADNHFHEVYIWWLQNQTTMGPQYNFTSLSSPLNNIPATGVKDAIWDARKIFFNKYWSGYYREDSRNQDGLPTERYPFAWPINSQPYWSGLDPETSFFKTTFIGTNDEFRNSSGDFVQTFDTSSLESIMYDLIAKVSFIKLTTDPILHNYSPEYVNYAKRDDFVYDTSEGKWDLISGYRYLWDEFNVVDDYFYINHTDAAPGAYYSYLGFISGKISSAFGIEIAASHISDNFTNPNRHKGPSFHLRTKPKREFEEVIITKGTAVRDLGGAGSSGGFGYETFKNVDTKVEYVVYNVPGTNLIARTTPADMPTGNYERLNVLTSQPSRNVTYYADTKVVLSLEKIKAPDFDSLSGDIYFHFPSTASGKVPYVPKQYIQSLGELKIALGEFVMAHNNEWFFSGRYSGGLAKNDFLDHLDVSGYTNFDYLSGLSTNENDPPKVSGIIKVEVKASVPLDIVADNEKVIVPSKNLPHMTGLIPELNGFGDYTNLITKTKTDVDTNVVINTDYKDITGIITSSNMYYSGIATIAPFSTLKGRIALKANASDTVNWSDTGGTLLSFAGASAGGYHIAANIAGATFTGTAKKGAVIDSFTGPWTTPNFEGGVTGTTKTIKGSISSNTVIGEISGDIIDTFNGVATYSKPAFQYFEMIVENSLNAYISGSLTSFSGNTTISGHNVPMYIDNVSSGWIPADGTGTAGRNYVFNLSGSQKYKVNQSLDVSARHGYDIIGEVSGLVKMLEKVETTFSTLSGSFYATSGRLINKPIFIEADLNEKPVILTQTFEAIPGWKVSGITSTGQNMKVYTKDEYYKKLSVLTTGFSIQKSSITIPPEIAVALNISNAVYNGQETYFWQHGESLSASERNYLAPILGVAAASVPTVMAGYYNSFYTYTEDSVIYLIDKDDTYIITDYFVEYTDASTNKINYKLAKFPYDNRGLYSGYSIYVSGIVSYDEPPEWKNKTSGEIIESVLSGKINKNNLQSYYNSGIIYGKHITDDVDMNIRVKRKEHIADSVQLVAHVNTTEPLIYSYNASELSSLRVTTSQYRDGTFVEIDTKGTKFEGMPFSYFGSDNVNGSGFLDYLGTTYSNSIFVQTAKIEETGTPVYIIPGFFDSNFTLYTWVGESDGLSYTESISAIKVLVKQDTSGTLDPFSSQTKGKYPKVYFG
jgi:hypothetical protein